MEKRYSELTEYELNQEIAALKEKARKAEQMGMVSEYAVYERKITMAKAYLMDPDNYKENEVYEIEGEEGSVFKISYMNGRFAWGHRNNESEESALPISLLLKKVEEK
ncbi:YfhH family protein [Anaerobacillus sp. MEB173]|uniref:YfhH family protein n=1 Tax=Anaerobacillus sp. MEB173 TaxID=3383345 RepID=UPI003F92161F